MRIKIILFYLFVFLEVANLFSQNTESVMISGVVTDGNKNPVVGASILIKGTTKGTYTGLDGSFALKEFATKKIVIEFTAIGYKNQQKSLLIKKQSLTNLNIQLEKKRSKLNKVVVVAKTAKTKKEEQGYAVTLIETKKRVNKVADAASILNATSGVAIRFSGGLGSDYNFSLNGLSGRQIKFFIDAIPIEELGEGFKLYNISVNQISGIEVYKGVVPISLGADALGGAVNLISSQKKHSYLDVSQSYGSFNTHRFSLKSQYRQQNSGFTLRYGSMINYSDNDYTIYDLEFFDSNKKEVVADVDRFHDRYKAMVNTAEIGFTKTRWADKFLLSYSHTKSDKQLQGTNSRALGEATEENNNHVLKFRFSKSDFLNKKLKLDVVSLYSNVNNTSIDTTFNRYSWDGRFTTITSDNGQGELLRPRKLYKFKQPQFLYRGNLSYQINFSNALEVNYLFADVNRTGGNYYQNTNPLEGSNNLKKTVVGLALTSNFFDKKLTSTLGTKYYHIQTSASDVLVAKDGSVTVDDIRESKKEIGYLGTLRYFITPNFYIKTSYEKGLRMPQPREIFGDGLSVLSNSALKPESSKNFNLGIQHTFYFKDAVFKNTLNYFNRDVNNFIYFRLLGVFSSYINEEKVLSRGVEWDGSLRLNNFLVSANVTYQQVLNNQNFSSGSIEELAFEKEQLPSTPHFFANASINYKMPKLLKGIKTAIGYDLSFVEAFYLTYKKVARLNDKNIIPSKLINNLSVTFSSVNHMHHLSLEGNNIFNAVVFDNFRQQLPGRSMSVKYRLVLDKK